MSIALETKVAELEQRIAELERARRVEQEVEWAAPKQVAPVKQSGVAQGKRNG